MNQRNLNLLYFFLFIGALSTIFLNVGWSDPDSYAFYNRYCLNGEQFIVQPLSDIVFSYADCLMFGWKFFQVFFGIITLVLIAFALEAFLGYDWKSVFLFLYSSSIAMFLLNFEDDNLAFPIVAVSMLWLLSKKNKQKSLKEQIAIISLYNIIMIFTGLFIWKGALIVMGLVLLWYIVPNLSWIGILLYSIFFPNGKLEGHVLEETTGLSVLANNPFSVIAFYFMVKESLNNFKEHILFLSFFVLSLLRPKWSVYFVIIAVWYLWPRIKPYLDKYKLMNIFCLIGVALFYFGCIWIIFNAAPSPGQWIVIGKAVEYQKQGYTLNNDWGVGRYVEFLEGKPSKVGGFGWQLYLNDEYYWLGEKIDYCITDINSGPLFLQKCFKPPVEIPDSPYSYEDQWSKWID